MSVKTKSEVEQQILAYVQETSKHLFVTKDGNLFKVITFKKDEKNYFATVMFGKKAPVVNVQEVLSDETFRWCGSDSLQYKKKNLFPEGHGMKSIPNFKASKEVINQVKTAIAETELKLPSNIKTVIENSLKDFKVEPLEEKAA